MLKILKMRTIITTIVLVLVLSLLYGCGSQEDITGEIIRSIDDINLSKVCPPCPEPECPKQDDPECVMHGYRYTDCDSCCPKDTTPYKRCDSCCPACDCPKCEVCKDFTKDPVEVDLYAIRIFGQQMPQIQNHTRIFDISNESKQDLISVELSYRPSCQGTENNLVIHFNGEKIFDARPECQKTKTIALNKDKVKVGSNSITFSSDVKETYRLENVEFDLRFDDNSYEILELDYVVLQKRIPENVKLDDLDDVSIRNYKEYSFNLTAEDIKQDLVLRFNSDRRDGKLFIIVNDNEVFSQQLKSADNEIVVEKRFLKQGPNIIRFLAISG